ncbi:hypothetical protein GW915_05900 [bacterium]|nr:hypothetical protein [bacterium]
MAKKPYEIILERARKKRKENQEKQKPKVPLFEKLFSKFKKRNKQPEGQEKLNEETQVPIILGRDSTPSYRDDNRPGFGQIINEIQPIEELDAASEGNPQNHLEPIGLGESFLIQLPEEMSGQEIEEIRRAQIPTQPMETGILFQSSTPAAPEQRAPISKIALEAKLRNLADQYIELDRGNVRTIPNENNWSRRLNGTEIASRQSKLLAEMVSLQEGLEKIDNPMAEVDQTMLKEKVERNIQARFEEQKSAAQGAIRVNQEFVNQNQQEIDALDRELREKLRNDLAFHYSERAEEIRSEIQKRKNSNANLSLEAHRIETANREASSKIRPTDWCRVSIKGF